MKWNENIAKKRPSMWYQDGAGDLYSINYGPRIRIIYPNGKIEWATLYKTYYGYSHSFNSTPCYINNHYYCDHIPKNQTEAIALMNQYDERMYFHKAEFLGWL